MKFLLDTCTFLWLTSDPARLSDRATESLNGATNLYLSDASVWEICLKWQAGKFKFPTPPRTWCEDQISVWNLESVNIQRSHMFRVTELPTHHKDPFDRLIVAQALEENLVIVTPDAHIGSYPVHVVW